MHSMVEPTEQDKTLSLVQDALSKLCPDWQQEEASVEHFLSGGYRNQNYRVRYQDDHYVLRLAERASGNGLSFKREHQRLKSLAQIFPARLSNLSVTVAPVVAAAPQHGLLLTRWCKEPLLADTQGVTAESLGEYLALLHKSLAQLPSEVIASAEDSHADGPNAFSPLGHIVKDLISAGASEQHARTLLCDLQTPSHPQTVCHLDLNPWNLLVQESSWVTLDWETLCLADPAFDLAALCDGYLRSQALEEDQQDFGNCALHAYNRACETWQAHEFTPYTQANLQSARQLFQWREYAWAAAQLSQGNNRAEIVEQRDDYSLLLTQQGFDVLPG